MIQRILLVLLVVVGVENLSAQQIEKNSNLWFTNINKYELNDKWYASSEIHLRRTNGFNAQQFLFRPAINWEVDDELTITAGYTYILSNPYGTNTSDFNVPEHNVWEELSLRHGLTKTKFHHRFRLEHRYIGKFVLNTDNQEFEQDGYRFAQRFRYRLTLTHPIALKDKLKAQFFNEIWLNLADNLMPLSFNQNWWYLGLAYDISDKMTLAGGFMSQVLNKGGNVYEQNPTGQFTLFYTFGKS